MGTWDAGPFDNDAAADFLSDSGSSPRALAATLRRCAEASSGDYLDVDDGQTAIAAAELVALGLGYGNLDAMSDEVRSIVRRLGPNEELRLLAIEAIPRIRDRTQSEVASLWAHDPAFDARLVGLYERLIAAGD